MVSTYGSEWCGQGCSHLQVYAVLVSLAEKADTVDKSVNPQNKTGLEYGIQPFPSLGKGVQAAFCTPLNGMLL